ncbi:FKBP-type peptidyl-prolyl cis-trans isomerase [Candidatus Albibeggiatoa sp. nov. NOAA]|uniref:FKBP-type peptidyl-prolyl cis-trans isomerase n=1 Tax=Candidatus Albibeggiatoa sp. nov. NOAA TaxID=3162724 RepID=UPI0032FEE684|nr:FKBP-type peptidyl-prolyl cis-trans isomerase [Thiotrichaceae bacterium]
MKLRYAAALTMGLFASSLSAAELTQDEKLSYSFGQNIGSTLKKQDIEINLDKLMLGIKEALAGEFTTLTEEQVQTTLMDFRKAQFAKKAEEKRQLAEKNRTDGEKFLAENAKKAGVKVTDSGLQYEILTEGKGDSPKATDTVTVHYRGTLLDGSEFDSSYSRNQPTSFALNRVIKGWTEGLQLMKPGGKAKFAIPSDLAYGKTGIPGGKIGPDSTLIFEVELISVDKK